MKRVFAVLVGLELGAVVGAAPRNGIEMAPAIDSVDAAYEGRPTWSSNELAPTSVLSREEAIRLAAAIQQVERRDIVVSLVAPTGSMRPYFNENALLLLESVPFESLKPGDVVTYYDSRIGGLVAHRLIEKRGNVFWSKGDHNRVMDSIYVTPENFRRLLVGIVYLRGDAAMPGGGSTRTTAAASAR
ncbi:MAG TPA: signal peptidase I [Opitutaceae bacterium]|nr:signal peptidase I [Opitutaceae bacterium]